MLYKGDTLYLNWLEDGIAELVFDAPGSVNKLDTATVASLGQALDVLEKQSELKGLLLRSNKAAFIVGADITEFLSLFLVPEEQLSQWLHFANSVFNRLEDLPVPTISAVNGYALGGGCELAMMCDIIIAADTAKFGQPEIKLGVIPGAGGTQRLPRAVGKAKAMDLALTARMMGAEEAERAGLVSRVVAADKLMEEALDAATVIASMSLPSVMMAKECVNRAFEGSLNEGLLFERRVFHSLFATEDQKEGMAAFTEKRKPDFKHR